ncbi:MAG: hypothetical protein DMG21_08530 [Acidobacteria bacterium]|nr:MAG: hypothetical protein DMG21_08530 [Acidobacteriota bacterium]
MASALPSALLRDAGRSRSVGARRAPLPPGTRMSELSQHEFSGRASSLTREGPEVMQAFVVRHRPFFILVAVLFAQLLLLSFQITRNRNVRLIQVWAVDVFSPFERALHWVGSGFEGAWKSVTSLRSTEKENLELRAERDRLQASVNALTEKAAAADRLRALLEFKKEVSYSTVAAEVIAASPGEHSATVSIGKGRDAGLTGDLAVITPAGVVGKTIAVFAHTSEVLLITDPSSGVGCTLEKSRVQGVLKGNSSSLVELHYVMNATAVEVGEAVPGNIYRKILVQPTAELDRLETVLVVTKPPAERTPKP